jgi:hypothetical protein
MDFADFCRSQKNAFWKEITEEVIGETEAYFEAKEKSYHTNGIDKLCLLYRLRRHLYWIIKSNFTKKMCFNMLAYELFRPTNCKNTFCIYTTLHKVFRRFNSKPSKNLWQYKFMYAGYPKEFPSSTQNHSQPIRTKIC